MDMPSLKAFLSVAKLASFSAAAEALHLTQPAVSKRISQLEQQLGVKLFDRVGRKVLLTESGTALYPRAQQLLLDMEDTRRCISSLANNIAGSLNIGTSHHIGLHHLPPILRHFSSNYPEVKLNIRFVDSERAYEDVLNGELELGIVTLPPQFHQEVSWQVLWPDPLCFVVGRDHELAHAKRVTLKKLTSFPAILPSQSTFTRRIAESLFNRHQLKVDASISTNYLETIKMMVSVGLGWSILPETMVDDSITIVPIKGAKLQRNLGCVYHPKRSLSNAAQAMLEELTKSSL